ncbi:hypothetical protein RMSM_05811 [Rhodopirellula maiorica SM1]|uniref:Uncharacterized protein n=1 Tax=Rhodopirellula maiorica SM1 TaxID=1265738 RepID=M5RD00_9BACT|nr:hypothetical protein RMSM_05811 [Rhodopirellula maiorica SM1]
MTKNRNLGGSIDANFDDLPADLKDPKGDTEIWENNLLLRAA